MSARGFTNPNFGKQVRVEQWGREVHLIFIGETEAKASDLVDNILTQLKAGAINITMMGKPTKIESDADAGR